MRNRFGEVAGLQPMGTPLLEALRAMAAEGALPARLCASGPSAEEAYGTLLRLTLEGFSTSLEADVATLEGFGHSMPNRRHHALKFRIVQKRGLRAELRAIITRR